LAPDLMAFRRHESMVPRNPVVTAGAAGPGEVNEAERGLRSARTAVTSGLAGRVRLLMIT
jgi:hypothetical protein